MKGHDERPKHTSDQAFRAIAEQAGVGIAMLDRDGRYVYVNDQLCAMLDARRGQLLGHTMRDFTAPEDWAQHAERFRRLVADGTPFTTEKRHRRPDGSTLWARKAVSPWRDDAGCVIGGIAFYLDLSDRKAAEAALGESEQKYRTLFNSIDQGFCIIEMIFDDAGTAVDYRFLEVNAAFEQQTGIAEAPGRTMRAIAPDHEEHWFETYGRVATSGEPVRFENPAAELGRFFEVYAFRIGPPEDRRVGVLFNDISERKAAERQRDHLIAELNHRVKNMLAIVQAVAHETFGSAATSEELRSAFESRLAALAAAHDLLTRASWENASLGEIAARVVRTAVQRPERFTFSGPPVSLAPKQAVTVTMALNELCSNALRHGALSAPGGRVTAEWRLSDGPEPQLFFEWRERGGPQVRQPARRGFGTLVIERALAQELDGEVRLDFEPEGLRCQIRAPLPAGEYRQ